MGHPFKHFVLITKHRNGVIKNASHMGIFWHALKHDMSKYGWTEFHNSSINYVGTSSPVYQQRLNGNYFSSICQHHTKRNPHHWEYWTDFYGGHILAKRMPWKYAVEYVCDMLSASKTYNKKSFNSAVTLEYFLKRRDHYFMNKATSEFVEWCLTQYRDSGWKNLKKKITKAKYDEIAAKYPEVEIFEAKGIEVIDMPELNRK